MGDWSLLGDGQRFEATGLGTISEGVSVSCDLVLANTKGLWTELIASTAFDASGLYVFFRGPASRDLLIDIGIGAALSEIVVVPDLLYSAGSTNVITGGVFIPIRIPAGSRVAARSAATAANVATKILCTLVAGGFRMDQPRQRVTAYGPNATDSGGTEIDPGATADTKGAWVQLTASTPNPIEHLIAAVGARAADTRATANWLVDIGVGGSGSEQVLIPNLPVRQGGTGSWLTPYFSLPVAIPAGTRLSARAQCNINTATSRLIDVACYGVD